jgi:hypothetical protein
MKRLSITWRFAVDPALFADVDVPKPLHIIEGVPQQVRGYIHT